MNGAAAGQKLGCETCAVSGKPALPKWGPTAHDRVQGSSNRKEPNVEAESGRVTDTLLSAVVDIAAFIKARDQRGWRQAGFAGMTSVDARSRSWLEQAKEPNVEPEAGLVTDTLLSAVEDIAARILDLGIKSGTWTKEEAFDAMDSCQQSMTIQMKYGRKHALDAPTLAAVASAVRRIADGLHVDDEDEEIDEETPE